MKDYSQWGEQQVIAQYFGTRKGTFLEIGANDGVTLSNAYALALQGWRGLCVEPSPSAFAKLELTHPATGFVKCINAAITPQDGPVDFYDSGSHLHVGDTALLSTTRPKEMERWRKSGETFTKTTVRGITIATLLKESGMTHFDFISVDCEGADYDVMIQCDLRNMGCKMLCIETHNEDNPKYAAYAAKHGLRLHRRRGENLIFVR